jgi:Short C-terminal domain
VGLFKRKDERAMPDPGTPEFDAVVEGSAIPDAQSVSMGESGWTSASSADVRKSTQSIDLRGTDTAAKLREALQAHGIDPDKRGQTIDATSVPGLRDLIASILGQVINIPNAGGFGGGVAAPKQDPNAVIEQLARKRDAGEITDAEFEAQKRALLGE